jgi:uncharacterized protein YcaQ
VDSITLNDLREYAVARSLFPPTTLKRAVESFGFIQADPIRAPARAQDLILRHRVKNYRAGDLESDYAKLGIEEDFFIVYGFVSRRLQAWMHPRSPKWLAAKAPELWPTGRKKRAQLVFEFVRERGEVHPREVNSHFAHGKVTNYWGGFSNATTHLMDAMHYRGLLRVTRREKGIRIYAARPQHPPAFDVHERDTRLDSLVDAAVQIYAPLPLACLTHLVRRLRYAAPQWHGELTSALRRAKQRLAHAHVDGVDWYWPHDENPKAFTVSNGVRLLAPFDPIVWDRNRLELLWNWVYRFEAYTPAPKRKLGYYALPMLWGDRIIGWGNLSVAGGKLQSEMGYIEGHPPRGRSFQRELEAELDRIRTFLAL